MCRVSVIIPCYNQREYIIQAIESVKAQTFSDWEIIIVDDGSKDKSTRAILSTLPQDNITLIQTENRGVAAARNTGVKASKGKYILPLDADDVIGKDYLHEAVKHIEADAKLKLIYCNGAYFGAEEGPIKLPDFDCKKLLQQNLIFCTALFKKVDFEEVGGYDEDFKIGWEDWELWLRLIKNSEEVYKLSEVHFFYRIKQESRNASLQNLRLQQAEQQLFNKHFKLYQKFYPNPISIIRDYEHLMGEKDKYEKYKEDLRKSLSYRLGSSILYPIKRLMKLGKLGR